MLLVLGALVGIPVAAVAYFLLKFVDVAQQYVFVSLPDDLGWDPAPTWWPILPLMFSGLVVALTIEHLHGTAGHEPAEGFKSTGPVDPVDLPGIVLASLATLCLGAVLGPEAPLIAIGSGLGVLAVHLVKKDAPATALVVIGTAGSFAAVSTLFGSPLAGAFLLMEAAGIGGPLLGVVLTPGLLAAGVGSLIFVGLDNWTGFGTFSLSVGPIPLAGSPTVAETCWAVGIGIIAAVLGTAIKRGALALRPVIARRRVLLTPLVGIAVALLAIGFAQATDKAYSYVLFDGQSALAPLLQNAADWSVGAVVLLTACKGTAYALSLSSFHGGPVFPGMFIGRGPRDRPLPPSRSVDDRRGRHGHRHDDRGHARPPDGLGPARVAAALFGRAGRHPLLIIVAVVVSYVGLGTVPFPCRPRSRPRTRHPRRHLPSNEANSTRWSGAGLRPGGLGGGSVPRPPGSTGRR